MKSTKMSIAEKRLAAIPVGLKIGERFLMAFDDPDLATTHQGRLQDLNSKYLCIDAPPDLRPARGTQVTISSLHTNSDEFSFSSEILGRRRLNGHLPVLLVKPPEQVERVQRRTAFRVSLALRAKVRWSDPASLGETVERTAVLTNLSGGGGQLYLRTNPSTDTIRLTVEAPDNFVKEWAKRQVKTQPSNRPLICKDPLEEAEAGIRAQFENVVARVVQSKVCNEDDRGTIHALSIAFPKPHECCYRLVRFLERQALQKGVRGDVRTVATAA